MSAMMITFSLEHTNALTQICVYETTSVVIVDITPQELNSRILYMCRSGNFWAEALDGIRRYDWSRIGNGWTSGQHYSWC